LCPAPPKRVTVMGSRSAYFIKASGHAMPRKQAGYMTAPDHNATNVTFSLQRRGRPYRTQYITGGGFAAA